MQCCIYFCWPLGEKLASSFIQQGLFAEALKALANTKISQKNLMTQVLLALNLKRCIHGESKLSQILLGILEKSDNFFKPQALQYSLDSLKQGEVDETSIQVIWSYLNLDQQQLLLCFLNNN